MPKLTREPSPPTEGDIRRDIELALNKQGLVRVFLNAQYNGPALGGWTRAGLGTGTADLVGYVLGTGRFFALEVKTKKGKASEDQEAWLAQTNREGGYAALARTPEEACEHAWRAARGDSPPALGEQIRASTKPIAVLGVGANKIEVSTVWHEDMRRIAEDERLPVLCVKLEGDNL